MVEIKDCNESEAVQKLRKLRNQEVKIYKKTIYRLSSGDQFEIEIGGISRINNLRIILGL